MQKYAKICDMWSVLADLIGGSNILHRNVDKIKYDKKRYE